MAANFELNELIMQLYDDNILDVEDVLLLLDAQESTYGTTLLAISSI